MRGCVLICPRKMFFVKSFIWQRILRLINKIITSGEKVVSTSVFMSLRSVYWEKGFEDTYFRTTDLLMEAQKSKEL